MLSKFFIDRPIFATVLSVVITVTGAIALWFLPIAQYPRIAPPSVQVSINYPGASAQVVAETVAAPIEQEVTGVPGMLYMSSQMGNDGSYSLSVTFEVDIDLNTAMVMVQNRVTLAMPRLPTPVQNQGVTIRKKSPDNLCLINFIAPVDVTTLDGKRYQGVLKKDDGTVITLKEQDGSLIRVPSAGAEITQPPETDIRLSNYVLINIKDEILRVDGVSDVSIMGQRDYSVRVWLDPQKMASRQVSATDVATAIRTQNLQAAAGQVGRPPAASGQPIQLPIHTLGRLETPEQFGNIIVKVGSNQPAKAGKGVAGPTSSTGSDDAIPDVVIPQLRTGSLLTGGATTGGGADVGGGATTGGGADPVLGSGLPTTGQAKRSPKKTSGRKPVPITGPTPPSVPIVRLSDVARVELGALNYTTSCTFDGGPSVGLNVYQLPGTNALDVGDRVRAKMKELKKRFPADVDYTIVYDTTPFIRESISEVFYTLRDAVILVAIVVLLFLQDWRAMVLPMIDVPVSLIGTFAVMAAIGYSLNNISLFGLVLAIGIVVDDAIVVLENIERQLAKGLDTRTATIKAMEEITGPIIAITIVLCAVFVPCAFISGITGRFFRQFAVTIAASTVISAINALTMTPSRALLIFKHKQGEPGGVSPAGGHHRKEALPWWFFGFLGGVATAWILPRVLTAEFHNYVMAMEIIPWHGAEEDAAEEIAGWMSWAVTAAYFVPGLVLGLFFGWHAINFINAVLGALFLGFNRMFDRLTDAYGWTIGRGLRLSAIVMLGYGGLVFITYFVFRDSPRGFVPQQDMGRVMVSLQLPDSASQDRTQAVIGQVDRIIRQVPGVAHTIGFVGVSFVESANGSNFGSFFVILEPFDKRRDTERRAEGIMKTLRARFAAEVTEARVVVAGSSPVPGVSTSGGFKLMVQDRGGLGLPTLQDQTDKFIRKVKQQIGDDAGKAIPPSKKNDDQKPRIDDVEDLSPPSPMLTNVLTQFRSNTPQLHMEIDREKAELLSVSFEEVNQTLQIFLGSLNVNRFNAFGRYWQVTLQADRQFRSRAENIYQLQIRNKNGQMVPLGTFVSVREKPGPIFVRRYNLYTAAPIGGALLPGVSSGEVIAAVDQLSHETLPRSMSTQWTELMFMQIREGNTSTIVFALAVVFVFLALAALYESWSLPLAVILVVPLCVLCSVLGVLVRKNLLGQDSSVDIFVQIGLVVLIGLACKNSILIVEFAREMHQNGKSIYDATRDAARLRLRPILMTSFAFILGVLPLCIAAGAGAEMRRSLGVAVFSGMLGVTVFGIFLTPVAFYVIQGVGETRFLSSFGVQVIGSCILGALAGAGAGYLFGSLGWVRFPWGPILGGLAGVLFGLSVMGLHRRLRKGRSLV